MSFAKMHEMQQTWMQSCSLSHWLYFSMLYECWFHIYSLELTRTQIVDIPITNASNRCINSWTDCLNYADLCGSIFLCMTAKICCWIYIFALIISRLLFQKNQAKGPGVDVFHEEEVWVSFMSSTPARSFSLTIRWAMSCYNRAL